MTHDEKKKLYAAPFPEHCIQRTEGRLTGRGYDTTGVGYQHIANRLNEVLGVGGWRAHRTVNVKEITRRTTGPAFERLQEGGGRELGGRRVAGIVDRGVSMLHAFHEHAAQSGNVEAVEHGFTITLHDPDSGAAMEEQLVGTMDLVVREGAARSWSSTRPPPVATPRTNSGSTCSPRPTRSPRGSPAWAMWRSGSRSSRRLATARNPLTRGPGAGNPAPLDKGYSPCSIALALGEARQKPFQNERAERRPAGWCLGSCGEYLGNFTRFGAPLDP